MVPPVWVDYGGPGASLLAPFTLDDTRYEALVTLMNPRGEMVPV